MNLKNALLLGFVPLVWCVHEILAISVHEDVGDVRQAPFTIDANPPTDKELSSTPKPENHSISLFLPESSRETDAAAEHVKTQMHVKEHQKKHSYTAMLAKTNKTSTIDRESKKKHQSWQIPSPLSPLATSDPKSTNSSKRQTEFAQSPELFIPSQEIGSYSNTEGFVPHSIHRPYYLPPKPVKHDANYGYSLGEPRLPSPAVRGFDAFEQDLEDLKYKYPEFNDLANNYPIMEEIVKQKIAEKFHYPYHPKRPIEEDQSKEEEDEKSDEDKDAPPKAYRPAYPFDGEDPKWISTKKPFAGEYYQEPIGDVPSYESAEKINGSYPETVKEKKQVSPWKRVLHLVTTLLPVGLLISALTPNVINISNVPDKRYPIRQRSESAVPDDLGNIVRLLGVGRNGSRSDPECDERRFCEFAVRGRDDDSSSAEKIYWSLAHSTPDGAAEAAGLRDVFGAIKEGQCGRFSCGKRWRRRRRNGNAN